MKTSEFLLAVDNFAERFFESKGEALKAIGLCQTHYYSIRRGETHTKSETMQKYLDRMLEWKETEEKEDKATEWEHPSGGKIAVRQEEPRLCTKWRAVATVANSVLSDEEKLEIVNQLISQSA